MDIHKVEITQADIDRVLAEASPVMPAGLSEDGCHVYHKNRSTILIGIAILGNVYPPAAAAAATAAAILDKVCEDKVYEEK